MSSVSFDPMAHKYDATRGYPEEVTRRITESIDKAANGNSQTRILEVGVGTGRFAIPVASLGRQYTGIDISEKMLSRLFAKLRATDWQEERQPWGSLPDEETAQQLDVQRFIQRDSQGTLRLMLADATDLPFRPTSFDAILAVHVFHLVGEWQKALQEVLRVVRPGGVLVRCWNGNWHKNWQPGTGDMRSEWSSIIKELGGSTELPGASDQTVTEWLEAAGFKTEEWEIISFRQETTQRAALEALEQRLWTSAQLLPDPLFFASLERLRQWADERYGASIDEPFIEERHVVVSRTQL